MIVNDAGRQIIMDAESLRLDAYLCPAGTPTIGYGHTGDVKLGQKITRHQAEVILEHDLEQFEAGVAKLAPKANANQFSALVSFAFNVGLKALEKSTLLKEFNAGRLLNAANEFGKWTHGGGRELPGLVKRRAAERALFLTGVS
jgi:lysozyme